MFLLAARIAGLAVPNGRTVFLLVVSFGCLTIAAFAVLARLAFPVHGPQPGPETLALGAEPPAVVNLLVNDLAPTDDAATAVLLDFARQRIVEFVDYGDGQEVLFLREPDAAVTRTYERRVLDFLRQLPRLDNGVPLAAVRSATAGTVDKRGNSLWWKQFTREVRDHARELGLVSARYPQSVVWSVQGGLGICVVAGVLSLGDSKTPQPTDPAGWSVLVAIACAAVAVWFLRKVNLEELRYTRIGKERARQWLGVRGGHQAQGSFVDVPPAGIVVWGENLVAASAVGEAPEASRRLQLAVGDGSSVWYIHHGEWAHARVRYPDEPWGTSPWKSVRQGLGPLLWSVAALALLTFVATTVLHNTDSAQRHEMFGTIRNWLGRKIHKPNALTGKELGPLVGLALGALLLAGFVTIVVGSFTNLLRGLLDLVARRHEVGVIALLRGGWVAVGDGSTRRVLAYRLAGSSVKEALFVGDDVELVATRFLGHVREVRKFGASRSG